MDSFPWDRHYVFLKLQEMWFLGPICGLVPTRFTLLGFYAFYIIISYVFVADKEDSKFIISITWNNYRV